MNHIFAKDLEASVREQFEQTLAQSYVINGALMVDAHYGYTVPIGGVILTDNYICPAYVGFDIGCGVIAIPTTFKSKDIRLKAKEIFKTIYGYVPFGFKHYPDEKHILVEQTFKTDKCSQILSGIYNNGGLNQLGTVGSNNHLVEIGVDKLDIIWVIVHCGSRNVGYKVAGHYMAIAANSPTPVEGHFGFKADSDLGKEYLLDMESCCSFAKVNRKQVGLDVIRHIAKHCEGVAKWHYAIDCKHNYVEQHENNTWIHRKGAIDANTGVLGVILGDMKRGSYITKGKGNSDSLWSSSHGAGRRLSRGASASLSLDKFQSDMVGIVANTDKEYITEAPDAYKNIHSVMKLQKDLLTEINQITPIINVKGRKDWKFKHEKYITVGSKVRALKTTRFMDDTLHVEGKIYTVTEKDRAYYVVMRRDYQLLEGGAE